MGKPSYRYHFFRVSLTAYLIFFVISFIGVVVEVIEDLNHSYYGELLFTALVILVVLIVVPLFFSFAIFICTLPVLMVVSFIQNNIESYKKRF